jgi:uncharacterized protein
MGYIPIWQQTNIPKTCLKRTNFNNMQKMAFFVFFSIVITVYLSINYYIYSRGMQAISVGSPFKQLFPYVFWGLVSTYIIGRTLEKLYLSPVSDVLVWTGSFWLGAMLYFFLIVLLFDIIRLFNHFLPVYPSFVAANYERVKFWLFAGSTLLVAALIFVGHINTLFPVVRNVDISIAKNGGNMKSLRAVLMSDIHLGTLIGNGQLESVVDKVQQINPDIILLAGDVLDEDLEPVLRKNLGKTLKKLHAPLGVFAVMGNHEYIGGADPAYEYLVNHGLSVIRDSVVKIQDSFYLVGREDRDMLRFSGIQRLTLEELMDQTDKSFPIILMDHQPYYPEKAAQLGVDLQVSGHTHHGQLWPLNFLTSAIFTISRGYGKIDKTHVYVSNGVGTWGPPVRIGTRPEIVVLNISFVGEK